MFISRTGYTGEHGYELIMANKDAEHVWKTLLDLDQRVLPCGLGARDSLRLEAGMPLYGHELNDDLTPLDVNLGIFVPKHRRHLFGLEERKPRFKRIGFVLNDNRKIATLWIAFVHNIKNGNGIVTVYSECLCQ